MRVSMLLGVLLLVAGAGLLTVGLLGWRRRLPRNRFAGVRTPATLRSDAAFIVANRVAAPPMLGAGAVCAAAGALALGAAGPALTVIVAVAGAGAAAAPPDRCGYPGSRARTASMVSASAGALSGR